MFIESIVKEILRSRLKSISRFESFPDEIQKKQFYKLVRKAKDTEWGKKYDYSSIKSYEDFAARVPIQNYDDISPDILRMLKGEQNILWPEKIKWFAQSSGTTDKSKFIPVSQTCLEENHYRGGQDTVVTYLNNVSDSKLFEGKSLIVGGSHKPASYNKEIKTGDLSAILIQNIDPIVNLFRIPSKKIILMDEWESKLNAICRATMNKNVTNLSGVPSWVLVLIKKVLKERGKNYLDEIWPNLEVFFHGGVSFIPYEEQYKSIIRNKRMKYMEVYNSSEGFFSIQNDLSDPAMLLMLDYGYFFEFMPVKGISSENPKVYRLQDIRIGENYALIISGTNGLWRYKIGDTVRFTSTAPYKFIITGRTKHFINVFGEELMIDNAEKALKAACKETGSQINEYTVAPVFMSARTKGKHQWLIEFDNMPDSMDRFTKILDKALQEVNSDYEAKRYKDMTLEIPEVIVAKKGLFYEWLQDNGKLGGQHKIPRLSNSREIMNSLIEKNR